MLIFHVFVCNLFCRNTNGKIGKHTTTNKRKQQNNEYNGIGVENHTDNKSILIDFRDMLSFILGWNHRYPIQKQFAATRVTVYLKVLILSVIIQWGFMLWKQLRALPAMRKGLACRILNDGFYKREHRLHISITIYRNF